MNDIKEPTATSMAELVREIAAKHGVSEEEIYSASLTGIHVIARQEVCYWARNKLKKTLLQIGRFIGRDHTTVLNSCRRFDAFIRGEVYVNVKNHTRIAERYDERKFSDGVKRETTPWSEDHARRLIAAAEAGRTSQQIANELGRTSVECRFKLYNLRKAGRTKAVFISHNGNVLYTPTVWVPSRDAKLLKMVEEGRNAAHIASELGLGTRAIRHRLKKLRETGKTTLRFAFDPTVTKRDRTKPYPVQTYVPKPKPQPEKSFLALLAEFERPPANVAVRDRQPILHNPSLYQGSGCSSSANMD